MSLLVQISKGGSFYSDFKQFLRTMSCFVPMCQSTHNPNMSIDEKYRLTYVAVTRARYNIKVFISKFDTQERFITDSNSKINTKEKFDDIDLMLKNIYI